MDKVRFGYFADFSDPTLLFFGSEKALEGMKGVLAALKKTQMLKLEEDIHFHPIKNIQLTLSLVEKTEDGGMFFIDAEKPIFEWRLSKKDIQDITEKLKIVIDSNEPCHHYLDSYSMKDEVTIQVSKDEYPNNFGSE